MESVGDGGTALATIERSVPDAVVLDVVMPGLDGLAVCRRVRAAGLDVPVLLLTARDGVAERVAGLDAGADDYVPKPVAPEELAARLRALLRRGRAAARVLAFDDVVLDLERRSAAGPAGPGPDRPRGRPARAAARPPARDRDQGAGDRGGLGTGPPSRASSTSTSATCGASSAHPPLVHTVRGVGFTLDRS